MRRKALFFAIVLSIALTGCSASKEGIEKKIKEFPVEMKKDASVFVLEKPELYYYDSDDVNYGLCILKIDTSKADAVDISLLDTSGLDDYDSFHASVYYDSDNNNALMASMDPIMAQRDGDISTFVFCSDASEKSYSDMELYLSLSIAQEQKYTVKTDNGSYEKNKENEYDFHGNALTDEDEKKSYSAQNYELLDGSMWESISQKIDFTNPSVKIENFENDVKKKITSKISGVERGTNESLDVILKLAKDNAEVVTDEDMDCAFQVIKKYYPNYYLDEESMELIIYCGALLDYATEDFFPESKVGFKALECVKYVYRGADSFDSEENKLHLERLKEYIKEYEIINN